MNLTNPITYTLHDARNEVILGKFYELEIQKVKKEDTDFWEVEKVIKKRKINGETEYFVKFLGYSNEHNASIKDLKKKTNR